MQILLPISVWFPVIGTVALNSRRGNNPGFKVLSINDSNGKPTDYATYCFDLSTAHPQWSLLYRCASTYHLGHNSLLNRINNFPAAVGNPMVISYREYFNGMSPHLQPINANANWPYYYGSISKLDSISYEKCISDFAKGSFTLQK